MEYQNLSLSIVEIFIENSVWSDRSVLLHIAL